MREIKYDKELHIKVGYQGMEGSNSEAASKEFIDKLKLTNVELIPLVTSGNVIDKLTKGEIDYGVMAVENSIGGVVEETKKAVKGVNIELITTVVLPIHHTMFYKSANIKKEDIKVIASHIQALKQSADYIQDKYPEAKILEVEDTAISAKYLSEGKLGEDTAIIARKNAGELYNLHMVADKIESTTNNKTTFHIYKLN